MKAVAAFPKEPPKKVVVRRCVKAAEEAWNRKSSTFKLKGFLDYHNINKDVYWTKGFDMNADVEIKSYKCEGNGCNNSDQFKASAIIITITFLVSTFNIQY
jgi:hypothetical protein